MLVLRDQLGYNVEGRIEGEQAVVRGVVRRDEQNFATEAYDADGRRNQWLNVAKRGVACVTSFCLVVRRK